MALIGQEIRRLREARELNQAQLAVSIGTGPSAISRIESGKQSPNSTTLVKLAEALQVEVADLFPKAEAPLPLEEPEEEAPAKLRTLIASWAHHAESLCFRMQELLDDLPALPDNNEVLADKRARILELQNDFWAMQRTLVKSGAAEAMAPYFRALSSGECVPKDIYEEISKFRNAQRRMNMDLIHRGDKWIRQAEETFGAFADPEAKPEVSQAEADWIKQVVS